MTTATDTATTPAVDNRQVVYDFFVGTHTGNLEVIDTLVAPQIVTHHFPGGWNPASREDYEQFFIAWSRGVPDMTFEIQAMVAEADQVAVHFSIQGHHQGELMGMPATGRALSFSGMVLYRLEQGQIAETWLYPDMTTLLSQLGSRSS